MDIESYDNSRTKDGLIPVLSLAIIGAVATVFVVLLPSLVDGFISNLGLDESEAGFIASSDMAGYTLATLFAVLWIHRLNWRTVIISALLLFIVVNFICTFASTFHEFLILRFITGFSAGTVLATAVAAMGKTSNPDRAFGFWIIGQLMMGSLGLLILPSIVEKYGMSGIFIMLAVFALPALLMARFVPVGAGNDGDLAEAQAAPNQKFLAVMGIFAIFLIYIGITSVWAYFARMGGSIGLSAQVIGVSLSIASLAGIAGAVGATIIGIKMGRTFPLLFAIGCVSIAMLILLQDVNQTLFLLAGCLFLFGWCFMVPYLMGAIAIIDKGGRLLSLANTAIGAGLVVGPSVGAILITADGYGRINFYGLLLIMVGMGLMIPLSRR
ncbi:MAG: hypothetical protein COB36_09690 [Alphaproteobacteria bacterium]|nr:MAG: hypothetical protein COB36_09690 [Alphaproteobacteria bacterium]